MNTYVTVVGVVLFLVGVAAVVVWYMRSGTADSDDTESTTATEQTKMRMGSRARPRR